MAQITSMELQNLRHLITDAQMSSTKWQTYAHNCQSPELRNLLQREAQSSQTAAQSLSQFLQ